MHAQFAVVVYDHATGTFLQGRTSDIQGAHTSLGYGEAYRNTRRAMLGWNFGYLRLDLNLSGNRTGKPLKKRVWDFDVYM
jgi:hypothetical protein